VIDLLVESIRIREARWLARSSSRLAAWSRDGRELGTHSEFDREHEQCRICPLDSLSEQLDA
jgi:hypothetical protein